MINYCWCTLTHTHTHTHTRTAVYVCFLRVCFLLLVITQLKHTHTHTEWVECDGMTPCVCVCDGSPEVCVCFCLISCRGESRREESRQQSAPSETPGFVFLWWNEDEQMERDGQKERHQSGGEGVLRSAERRQEKKSWEGRASLSAQISRDQRWHQSNIKPDFIIVVIVVTAVTAALMGVLSAGMHWSHTHTHTHTHTECGAIRGLRLLFCVFPEGEQVCVCVCVCLCSDCYIDANS